HHHAVQECTGCAINSVVIIHLHAEIASCIAGNTDRGTGDLAGIERGHDVYADATVTTVPGQAQAIVRQPCPAHQVDVRRGRIDHYLALQDVVGGHQFTGDPRKRDLVFVGTC